MTLKGFTLFSGFEGVGIGMKAAGMEHVGGIEYDDAIAQVARDNGFDVTTADVLTAVPDDFPDMDLLHASSPCPNFSQAKTNAQETEQDIALAQAVARWIVAKLPAYFTLENVYQYRNSQSWSVIARALLEHGFSLNYWHVNMADYGVPQTRKRMIVIARRDGRMPMLPPATHAENPVNGLFGSLLPWIGWYEAIEDLIPSLPNGARVTKNLTDWYGEKPAGWVLFENKNRNEWGDGVRHASEPSHTITTDLAGRRSQITRRFCTGHPACYLTPLAAACLQAFPDWYRLPESNRLAQTGIGNAVPPLFYQRIAESLL